MAGALASALALFCIASMMVSMRHPASSSARRTELAMFMRRAKGQRLPNKMSLDLDGGELPIPIEDDGSSTAPGSNIHMFEHGLPPLPNPAARRWTWMQQHKHGYIPAQGWLSPTFFRQRMLQRQLRNRIRPVLSMGDLPIPIGYDGDMDNIAPGSNMNMYENAIPTTIPYAPDPAGWGMDYSPYVVPNLDDPNY
ncbi:hypothetical protein GUITHDRAFT_153326 [Guillardia theta CCMP2712]|uniref:Uncharacterized protein n=2 Tax=Guillardia theta TaxID=55529 RepID=L1J5I7_GUITC|nr:hypothetical protein GUITHDRAFT_153326 [Guillardia theta CCMP2712]EKX43340.1 hypothetical protein GUITHDRAFT_153326 [Guillardia theta CCMP2712]|eukprot:XP_005830320.1 hypothetical protein GUITHDRAFT_153326 [Guillardia theta CCMP2712]